MRIADPLTLPLSQLDLYSTEKYSDTNLLGTNLLRYIFIHTITNIITMDILFRITLPRRPEMAAYKIHRHGAEKRIQIA